MNNIKRQFDDWLAQKHPELAENLRRLEPSVAYEIELRERAIRVEEELQHQRELMQECFAQVNQRFEAIQVPMDKRLTQVDKQLELQRLEIQAIGKTHDRLLWAIFAGMLALFFKDQLVNLL